MNNEADSLEATRWSLIARLKNWEDQESWKDFFDSYWRLIYGFARKAGLSGSEAEDVVQETFISVAKHIGAFKADPAHGSFKSWLLTIVRWRISDRMRRVRREVVSGGISASNVPPGSTSTQSTDQVPDPKGPDLDAIWEKEWQQNLTDAALEKLERQCSAAHYQVFLLHVIKGMPAETVAKVAGMTTNQVYLVKHRLAAVFQELISSLQKEGS